MRTFIFLITFHIGLSNINAQSNSIFIELGGNSLGPSINYQRQLGHQGKFGLRIGIGSAWVSGDQISSNPSYFGAALPDEQLCIPISMNYLIDLKYRNYLEVGLGYTWINFKKNFESNEQGTHNLIPSIGYLRRFGKGSGWMWKASLTPLAGGNRDKGFVFGFSPMAGVSIGKLF